MGRFRLSKASIVLGGVGWEGWGVGCCVRLLPPSGITASLYEQPVHIPPVIPPSSYGDYFFRTKGGDYWEIIILELLQVNICVTAVQHSYSAPALREL